MQAVNIEKTPKIKKSAQYLQVTRVEDFSPESFSQNIKKRSSKVLPNFNYQMYE